MTVHVATSPRPLACLDPRRRAAHRPQPVRVDVGDLVVGFDPDCPRLPGAQRAALERWVAGWVHERPHSVVVLAHDANAAPPTRSARLRGLRNAVERLGVRRENIKYTESPFHLHSPQVGAMPGARGTRGAPGAPGAPAHAPLRPARDAVMLKLTDARHEVRSLARSFDVND